MKAFLITLAIILGITAACILLDYADGWQFIGN